MALRIGDTAPNFSAQTTEGQIEFHQWIGDKWAVLFSHPKDFTPVCTTELGTMARMKAEFDKRNVKIIGLSADPVDDHKRWAKDIEETQGTAPNYPIIGDSDLEVGVADDRVVRGLALRLGDVLRPALVIARRVHRQADDLHVALVELGLEPRHVAQLGRAHGGEVLRM